MRELPAHLAKVIFLGIMCIVIFACVKIFVILDIIVCVCVCILSLQFSLTFCAFSFIQLLNHEFIIFILYTFVISPFQRFFFRCFNNHCIGTFICFEYYCICTLCLACFISLSVFHPLPSGDSNPIRSKLELSQLIVCGKNSRCAWLFHLNDYSTHY